jgi:hypothetical protein
VPSASIIRVVSSSGFAAEFVNTASNILFLVMPPLLMRLHQPYAARCGKGGQNIHKNKSIFCFLERGEFPVKKIAEGQSGCTLDRKCIPRNETARPRSHSYIHVSVSDLYIPRIGLPILLQPTGKQNIIILFWKKRGCAVSFLGILKSELDITLYWILTGQEKTLNMVQKMD